MGYPIRGQHNGGRGNKTILSQPSPSEDQQQLHVVVKASAANEFTRMAHTLNKKLPKMPRRISFEPCPCGRCNLESRVRLPSVVCSRCRDGKRPIQRGPPPHRLYSTASKSALLQTFGLRQPRNGFVYITPKQLQSNRNATSEVIKLR